MNPGLPPPESWLPQPSESESDSSSESDSEPLPEDGIYTDDFWSESESESESDSDLDLDSEPSVKKQKVEEEEESSDYETLEPLPMTYDHTNCCKRDMEDSDDEFVTDKDCRNKYFQQLRESQGFDIKDYPGAFPGITVFPKPHYLEYPTNVEKMTDYAAQALTLYNEKFGTKYEVNEILKVNGDECGIYLIYYITFTVTNGEKEYFQAKVVWRIGGSMRFSIVRPRAKGASGI